MSETTIVVGNAQQDGIRQKRGSKAAAKHRSRGGCLTCKQKHVKCDETKPSCQNCRQKGLSCPGYSKGFTWSYKHQPGQRRKSGESTRRLSQSTDNGIGAASEYVLSGSASAGADDSLSPSLLSIDAIYTPNSPTLSNDVVNVYPMDIGEPWDASSLLFNENIFGCGNQAMGLGFESPELSEMPLMSLPRDTNTSQSLSLPPRISGGPEATEALMKSWFDQVCPAWSAFDSCLNPNRKIASELMHHSQTVFDTLQSMSAGFLSARLPQMRRPAIRLLKKAATSVILEADALRGKPLDTVPTGLLFSLFCLGTSVCWLDARRLGLPFLKEAKELIHRLSWQACSASDDQLETLAFFKKNLVYYEMLLSFVDDYDSTSDSESNEQTYQLLPMRDNGDMNTDLFLHPWTGISTRTSRLFARTIRLCRSYRRRMASPTGSEIAMSAAMQEIQDAQKLEAHLMSLEFTSAAPLNQTGDEKTPWLHLAYVAEAYQLASLLQLYLTFPDLVAMRLSLDPEFQASEPITCDKWTIPLALRLIKILEQIPPESGSRVIQPLLYICASTGLCYNVPPDSSKAGCLDDGEASSFPTTSSSLNILGYIDQMDTSVDGFAEEAPVREIAVEIGNARNFIVRRLDTLECTLQPRPIAVAKELVKAIWAVYDDESRGCMSGHWIDVMESQDLRSLFG